MTTENRFTPTSQKVVEKTKEEAKRLNHDYVGTEHILLSLMRIPDGMANEALVNLGLTPSKIRTSVENAVGVGDNDPPTGDIPWTPRAKKVVELAVDEATKAGVSNIGTEHILVGLVREGDGVAARVLESSGLKLEDLIREIGRLSSDKLIRGVGSVLQANKHSLKAQDTRPAIARFMRVLANQCLPLDDLRQAIDEARDSADPVSETPSDRLAVELADRLVDF